MKELSNLVKSPGATTPRRRVARGHGGKGGQRAGTGNKGQKSRSGVSFKPGFEGGQMPLQRRIPKRGFRNINRVECETVNVERLNVFVNDSIVNPEVLFQRGFIKKPGALVKVLGNGDLSKNLKVAAHKFSRKAEEKIKKSGGTVEVIEQGKK